MNSRTRTHTTGILAVFVVLALAAIPARAIVIYSADFEASTADGTPTFNTGTAADPWLSETEWSATVALNELYRGTYATHLSSARIGNSFGVLHSQVTNTANVGINFADNMTYTFSFDHFRRSDTGVTFGESVTAQIRRADNGGILATATFAAVTGATASDIVNRSVQWTTSGGDEVGKGIRLVFIDPVANTAFYQAGIDNITLDATPSVDLVAPTIVPPTDPADEASGVLVSSDLVATFDENIALTGAGTVTIRDLGPGPDVVIDLSGPDPDGTVSVTGAVLRINPTSNLVAGNPYAIQISADAIADLAAPPNAFAGILDDTTWNFQTAADGTAPTIVFPTSPADGASGVAVNTNLVATFDETIAAGSGNITIKNITEGTDTVIPVGDAQVSVSGTDLTIDPTTDLDPGDDYAIQIDTGAVTDTTGNLFAGIDDGTTWNFTTLADTVDPTLVLPTIPADDAVDVTVSSLLAIFSEPIAAGSGDITIKNLTEATATSIAVSDSSQVSIVGNVLTVTPDTGFETSTAYAIQVGASAITDLSGNPFAGIGDDTTWNFTTGTSIAITNHSFEAQVLGAPPGDTVLGVTGWTTFSGNPGTGRTSPAQYAGGVDGNNYAWTNNASGIQDTLRQMLGVDLQANTTYTLTVAVGWRADLPGLGYTTFPGYGIELYAGGILVASDYDTTNGGTGTNPASGAWTDATTTFTSASSVTPGQALEIRLVGFFEPANPNGWGVQTNYDNVRLTAQPATGGGNDFSDWIGLYPGVGGQTGLDQDPDGDGNDNGVENFFGTDPSAFSAGLIAGTYDAGAGTFTFTHPQNATPADDLTAAYQWSKDLQTFYPEGPGDGTTVTFLTSTDAGITTVTATVTGTIPDKLFVNVLVTQ